MNALDIKFDINFIQKLDLLIQINRCLSKISGIRFRKEYGVVSHDKA